MMDDPGGYFGTGGSVTTALPAPPAWWPGALSLFFAITAVGCVVLGAVTDGSAFRMAMAVTGYVLGAVLVAVASSVQRSKENQARRRGARTTTFAQRVAPGTAVVALWIGLLAGVGNAWLVATEIAK